MARIRILHILHSMNRGGAENALMNYYRHIDRNIVQFDFLLTAVDKCQFEDEIISMGGKIFRIPLLKFSNPFPYINGVKSFLKSHPEYKILHSHTSSKSLIPLCIAMFCGVPIRCSHSHSSQAEPGIKGLIRNFLRPFLKLVATDYISCGEQAAIYLYGRKAFENKKVTILKNVIETDSFCFNPSIRDRMRKELGICENELVLGHTARFDPVKNHFFDVEILKSLIDRGIRAKLLLVGGGELENDIRDKIQAFGLHDYVIWAGIVSNVWDYEQAMDVFLLPSFNEGLPLSIIEAQVAGLPCFTRQNHVSIECSVTNLVKYLPLEVGAEKWADDILHSIVCRRKSYQEEVVHAGYDAKTSAKKLQEYYLKRYEEMN